MSKERLREDVKGDEARQATTGPMPEKKELTANDLLSTERTVDIDEWHQTFTTRHPDSLGIERLSVQAWKLPGDEVAMPKRAPSIAEWNRQMVAERQAVWQRASEQVVPSIDYRKPTTLCWLLVRRDGHGAEVDGPIWCQQDKCPAWSAEDKCAENRLTLRSVLVRRYQPATMEEYQAKIKEPYAERGGDTDDRIREVAAELGRVEAEKKAVLDAANAARDAEIMRLRRLAAGGGR